MTKWCLDPLAVADDIGVHYNVGHLAAAEGDTKSPDGKYLFFVSHRGADRSYVCWM